MTGTATLGQAGGIDTLRQTDFDFDTASTSGLTHGIHPYPAKFIPQIPRTVIDALSAPGDTVADVFCGSGTTLVEAMIAGRHAIGVDANPIAVLIARAKTARIDEDIAGQLLDLARRADAARQLVSKPGWASDGWRPSGDNLDFWFEPNAIEELAEALKWIHEVTHEQVRLLATAAFSSIVVAASRQDSDTRYVRTAKRLSRGDIVLRFARSLRSITKSALDFSAMAHPEIRVNVIHADMLANPKLPALDLVVCSPPYPNAYSYHLYHRTRMLWLRLDQAAFKKQEIGSHRKYSAQGRNAVSIRTFEDEMSLVLRSVRARLRPDGFAVFVIGDSTIRGERHDNASLLERAAGEAGLRLVLRRERRLQDGRKSFNPRIGRIKTECILIFGEGRESA